MKLYLQMLILLFAQYGFGQTAWKAELPVVEKSDYYHIELNQELIGAGLNHLKILDENDNETPYFIRSANPVQEISNFESFEAIDSVKISSLCRYACAYLEAGKKYRIALNSQEPVVAAYDIEYFRDKIPADIAVLKTKNLSDYVVPETVIPKRGLILLERPLFLWSVITVMGIFLVFICVRMIKEIKKGRF